MKQSLQSSDGAAHGITSNTPEPCPLPERIANFVTQILDDTERHTIEAHVDHCDICRTLLTELIREAHPSEPEQAPSAFEALQNLAGSKLGRFELQAYLGGGAMGVVYAAFDTELEREVAIKLVRPFAHNTTQAASETLRSNARVLTEARALAGVLHRNVVAIYDVGIVDGTSFIVMEKIAGDTLATWLTRKPSVAARRAVLHQIALGLAAAHQHGIVHRDVKPTNVLIADDRAVVIDFGLAAVRDLRTPGVAGTPAYMAPEAVRGEPLSPRSDIFSFACMAYECFVGASPFAATSLAQRQAGDAASATHAALPHHVPKQLANTIRAGLDDDAARRPLSMEVVANAFRPSPTPRWRWLAGLFLLGGLGAIVWWRLTAAQLDARAACRDTSSANAAAFWTAADDARLTASFAATGKPYALTVATTVQNQAKQWRDTLLRVQLERCAMPAEATSPATLRCFDQLRITARTDVERTMTATAYAVEHAVANIFALPSPTLCLQQPEQIAAIVPSALPLALQQRVNQMRNAIGSGDSATASQVVDQIMADATWQQAGPHRAFVYFAVGEALQLAGHRNLDAQRYLEQAARLADEARQDYLRADAQLLLAHMQISDLKDAAAAQKALDQAITAITRAGNPPALTVRANVERAILLMQTGDNETAAKTLASIVAADALGPASPASAAHLDLYGNALQRNQPAAAATAFARAVELWDQLLGPQHPDGAIALTGLAGALLNQGKLEEAAQTMQQAVQRAQLTLAPDHPILRTMRSNLANLLMEAGHHDQAVSEHEALVAIARSKRNAADRGRELAFARAQLDLATALSNAGRDLIAKPLADDSVAIYTQWQVPTPMLVRALYVQGAIHGQLNDIAGGVAALERALKLLGDAAGVERAAPMFMLAQFTVATQPQKAKAMAQAAAQLYTQSGNSHGAEEIATWLAKQK